MNAALMSLKFYFWTLCQTFWLPV